MALPWGINYLSYILYIESYGLYLSAECLYFFYKHQKLDKAETCANKFWFTIINHLWKVVLV